MSEGSLAGILQSSAKVRFTPESTHRAAQCLAYLNDLMSFQTSTISFVLTKDEARRIAAKVVRA
jgi:hypothetical protein